VERTFFRRFGLLGPLAQDVAGEPADPELDRNEDELAGWMSGDLVDDDCRAAENDGQADGRPAGVAQVPK
jgi:hypothetical protein